MRNIVSCLRVMPLLIAAGLVVSCAGNSPTLAPFPILTPQPTAPPATASPLAALPSPTASPTAIVVSTPSPSIAPTKSLVATFGYQVVHTYPHDTSAFTEGLVFDNGFLYESTGLEGRSSLRRTELETGQVLQRYDLPADIFGEGLTLFGGRFIQLTWKTQLGYVYDKTTFRLLREFNYPTEGWGLTQNGSDLIMSDGTATIYFMNPDTFERVRQIEVYDESGPVTFLNELEYVRGEIYANVWQTDRVARIDPATGRVLGWIDLTGLLSAPDRQAPVDVLNGIAYDEGNNRLFVTGKLWPKLYEIKLIPLR